MVDFIIKRLKTTRGCEHRQWLLIDVIPVMQPNVV